MPRRPTQELDRYLLDGERIVTAVHQHWAKVAEPVATLVLVTVLAFWIDLEVPANAGAVADAAWLGWFVALGRTAYKLLQWHNDWFVATDKRLLLFYGIVTRKVAMMPLGKVTDMSYHRTIPGRLLGYGTFVLESAGQDQALSTIDYLPDPDRNYRAICAEIFGVPDSGPHPDEPEDGGEQDGPGDGPWHRPSGNPGPIAPSDAGGGGSAGSPADTTPWDTLSADPAERPFSLDEPAPRRTWIEETPDRGRSLYRSADLTDDDEDEAGWRTGTTSGPSGHRRPVEDTSELYLPRDWA